MMAEMSSKTLEGTAAGNAARKASADMVPMGNDRRVGLVI
jgi:hypothetical protein